VASPDKYDVIIIGGGPAGMSTAVACADLGLRPVLIERNSTLGGQLLWTHNPITNYLGAEAANGAELAATFAEQVDRSNIEIVAAREVTSVDLSAKKVVLDETILGADAIVIAAGVRRRKLEIPGENEFVDRGILASGARGRDKVEDKTVVIIGGGDAAVENALILSDHARRVVVVHRRHEMTARPEFLSRSRERSNVEFILETVVTAIEGKENVERVRLESSQNELSTIHCDAILIRVGVEPNTELFDGQITLDQSRYVVVDKEFRTSAGGVWAVGDIAGPLALTIANAVGSGSVAARSIKDAR
jgi:thioredoxin reductase (NADPH)